jgi:hypothetical protein
MKRGLQYVLGVMLALSSIGISAATIANWGRSGPAGLLMLAFPLFIFGTGIGILQLQIRALNAATARVRANIERVAKTLFDKPAEVRPGYDRTVTNTPGMAAWGAQMDDGTGFTTDGTFRGARVSSASLASTLARQMGELQHTYSYVVVDLLGLTKRFFIGRDRATLKAARMLGTSKDVKIGDAAFDEMFAIDADEGLARDVLADESIKKRIADLQSKVGLVSQEMGVGGMWFMVSQHGLAVRWPGEMNPELAAFARDLLLDMRERILAHENRVAARVAAGAAAGAGGYRVAAEDEAAAAALEAEAEAEAEIEAEAGSRATGG